MPRRETEKVRRRETLLTYQKETMGGRSLRLREHPVVKSVT